MTATREQTADRLLRSSLRNSYDPTVEIDWDAPFVPGAFWIPPHRSSLYGTELWHGLSHDQRVELTKHEVVSSASAGIWFETILMQMLVRHYFDQDPTSRHAQYALTELADECRHSVMFGRLIERLGCPPYPANRVEQALGRFVKTTATGAHMYAGILLAEEILDAFQREIMDDDSLQPLIRMVSRIHVVEESRHVRFAREELVRQVQRSGRLSRGYTRRFIGATACLVTGRLVHPRAYAAVGIEPAAGRAAARANPNYWATLRWAGERIVAYFTELDLVTDANRGLLRRSGLI